MYGTVSIMMLSVQVILFRVLLLVPVQVTLIDYGRDSAVAVDKVRVLQEAFVSTPWFAHRCHLADLQPAGGTNKWSQTACNVFREALEEDDIKLCLVVKVSAYIVAESLCLNARLKHYLFGHVFYRFLYSLINRRLRASITLGEIKRIIMCSHVLY